MGGIRFCYGGLLLVFIYVLLEEIDYGLHYAEYIAGAEPYDFYFGGFRNIHNLETMTNPTRFFRETLAALTIVAMLYPALVSKISRKIINLRIGSWARFGLVFSLLFGYYLAMTIETADGRQLGSESLELILYTTWSIMIVSTEVESNRTT